MKEIGKQIMCLSTKIHLTINAGNHLIVTLLMDIEFPETSRYIQVTFECLILIFMSMKK